MYIGRFIQFIDIQLPLKTAELMNQINLKGNATNVPKIT